jgi:hypothetical protein
VLIVDLSGVEFVLHADHVGVRGAWLAVLEICIGDRFGVEVVVVIVVVVFVVVTVVFLDLQVDFEKDRHIGVPAALSLALDSVSRAMLEAPNRDIPSFGKKAGIHELGIGACGFFHGVHDFDVVPRCLQFLGRVVAYAHDFVGGCHRTERDASCSGRAGGVSSSDAIDGMAAFVERIEDRLLVVKQVVFVGVLDPWSHVAGSYIIYNEWVDLI